jgi:hypothetical protein
MHLGLFFFSFHVAIRSKTVVLEENVKVGERGVGATGTHRVQLEVELPRGEQTSAVRNGTRDLSNRGPGGAVQDEHVEPRRG